MFTSLTSTPWSVTQSMQLRNQLHYLADEWLTKNIVTLGFPLRVIGIGLGLSMWFQETDTCGFVVPFIYLFSVR